MGEAPTFHTRNNDDYKMSLKFKINQKFPNEKLKKKMSNLIYFGGMRDANKTLTSKIDQIESRSYATNVTKSKQSYLKVDLP